MSFFDDLLTDFFRDILFNKVKWLGISIKWLFYLGKKPIAIIKQENWNTRIGFLVFIIIILTIVLIVI